MAETTPDTISISPVQSTTQNSEELKAMLLPTIGDRIMSHAAIL